MIIPIISPIDMVSERKINEYTDAIAGLQQSLDYICKIMPNDRSTVIMEEPGYNTLYSFLMRAQNEYDNQKSYYQIKISTSSILFSAVSTVYLQRRYSGSTDKL